MTAVLTATEVSVAFGGVQALQAVDIEVPDGKLVGVIGPNGAGKTTFIDAVSGFVKARGRIELDGRDLGGMRPHARARLGLARTWQSIELFDDLTVWQNLAAAAYRPTVWASLKEAVMRPFVGTKAMESALRTLGLFELADARPADLTQAQRKLVGVARALATEPRILCLDEPAAGLDIHESDLLGDHLRDIVDAGNTILLVDHDMSLVLRICDEIVVLEFGEVIARGTPEAIRHDPRVIAAYLGGADGNTSSTASSTLVVQTPAEPERAVENEALRIADLTAGYGQAAVIRGLDLIVGEGEVVALLGANGAGKTTTLRAVSGVVKPMAGQIFLSGQDLAHVNPSERARRGIAHVPEGRGIFFGLTVHDHFRLGYRGETLDEEAAYTYFPVLRELRSRRAGLLSGGEQQMLALGRALARHPSLLLLDELSLGLAPVIVERLLPVVRQYARDSGCGVLLVEQHVQIALEFTDRAYILYHGEIILHRPGAELRGNHTLIASSYLGDRAIESDGE